MSKRQNYYQVHKNKKPNKKLPKGLHPKVLECIRLATEVVNKAIELAKSKVAKNNMNNHIISCNVDYVPKEYFEKYSSIINVQNLNK